jgi:hypothetical protein
MAFICTILPEVAFLGVLGVQYTLLMYKHAMGLQALGMSQKFPSILPARMPQLFIHFISFAAQCKASASIS